MNFNKWIKGCLKKRRYAEYSHAEQAIINQKKTWGLRYEMYYCPDCQGYHLAKIRGNTK